MVEIFPWENGELPHLKDDKYNTEWYIDEASTAYCKRKKYHWKELDATVFYIIERVDNKIDLIVRVIIDNQTIKCIGAVRGLKNLRKNIDNLRKIKNKKMKIPYIEFTGKPKSFIHFHQCTFSELGVTVMDSDEISYVPNGFWRVGGLDVNRKNCTNQEYIDYLNYLSKYQRERLNQIVILHNNYDKEALDSGKIRPDKVNVLIEIEFNKACLKKFNIKAAFSKLIEIVRNNKDLPFWFIDYSNLPMKEVFREVELHIEYSKHCQMLREKVDELYPYSPFPLVEYLRLKNA